MIRTPTALDELGDKVHVTDWAKVLVGVLLVPALGVFVALVLLFGRVSAVESAVNAKPDSAAVNAMRREMLYLREDIRDLRTELRTR